MWCLNHLNNILANSLSVSAWASPVIGLQQQTKTLGSSAVAKTWRTKSSVVFKLNLPSPFLYSAGFKHLPLCATRVLFQEDLTLPRDFSLCHTQVISKAALGGPPSRGASRSAFDTWNLNRLKQTHYINSSSKSCYSSRVSINGKLRWKATLSATPRSPRPTVSWQVLSDIPPKSPQSLLQPPHHIFLHTAASVTFLELPKFWWPLATFLPQTLPVSEVFLGLLGVCGVLFSLASGHLVHRPMVSLIGLFGYYLFTCLFFQWSVSPWRATAIFCHLFLQNLASCPAFRAHSVNVYWGSGTQAFTSGSVSCDQSSTHIQSFLQFYLIWQVHSKASSLAIVLAY